MSTDAATLERRVARAVTPLLHGVQRLLVGFSGGPDSTALMLLLKPLFPDLEAVHFDHCIRGDAAKADAAWCDDFCAARGIRFVGVCLDVPARRRTRESLEMAARRCRLEYWRQQAAGTGIAVALGHHADDRFETLLLRLLRGANSSGLTGLRAERRLHGVRFIRPLLEATRAELREYLQDRGISHWRRDSTNEQLNCQRNRLRHEVIPRLHELMPGRGWMHTNAWLEADARFIEDRCAKHLAAAGNVLTRDLLLGCPNSLWPRLLRQWLHASAGIHFLPRARHLRALARQATEQASAFELDLSDQWRLTCDAEGVFALTAIPPAVTELNRSWQWPTMPTLTLFDGALELRAEIVQTTAPLMLTDPERQCFRLASMPEVLQVRSRRPGDRMVPFGEDLPRRLKKLIGNAHLSAAAKRHLVLICHPAGGILWVPGVRRAAVAAVGLGDEPVLALSVRHR